MNDPGYGEYQALRDYDDARDREENAVDQLTAAQERIHELEDQIAGQRNALNFARVALLSAHHWCPYHGDNPPETPPFHGGCDSCQQPIRVRQALEAIRALDGGDR